MTRQYWVGLRAGGRDAFRFDGEPSPASHGERYAACWGPFPSLICAVWVAAHSAGNPHMATAAQAVAIYRQHRAAGTL